MVIRRTRTITISDGAWGIWYRNEIYGLLFIHRPLKFIMIEDIDSVVKDKINVLALFLKLIFWFGVIATKYVKITNIPLT